MSWIYLAGPLFTLAEVQFNETLAEGLQAAGYRVYLPQAEAAGVGDPKQLFALCLEGLAGAGLVVAILDGADADSGTCFEMGYAYAKGLPVVGLRTDFRGSGEHLGVNLMLVESCTRLILTSFMPLPDTEQVIYLEPGGDVLMTLVTVLDNLPAASVAKE